MGRLVLFDAIGAAILLGAWFFYFTRYNRRKGAMALRWVESACSSKGPHSRLPLAEHYPAPGPFRFRVALVRQRSRDHSPSASPDTLQVVCQRLAQAEGNSHVRGGSGLCAGLSTRRVSPSLAVAETRQM